MSPIETERLILRRFAADDAAAMRAVLCDPEVMRFSLLGTMAADAVDGWVVAQRDNPQLADGLGRRAIELRATGAVIGFVGLGDGPSPREPGDAELGYRLARRHWGRGYATEATRAVVDYGLSILKLPRILGLVDPQNRASVHVLRKIGMTYVRPVMLDGYDHADHLFARTQRDRARRRDG